MYRFVRWLAKWYILSFKIIYDDVCNSTIRFKKYDVRLIKYHL